MQFCLISDGYHNSFANEQSNVLIYRTVVVLFQQPSHEEEADFVFQEKEPCS